MGRAASKGALRDLLDEARSDWDVSPRTFLAVTSLPFVLAMITVIAALGY